MSYAGVVWCVAVVSVCIANCQQETELR